MDIRKNILDLCYYKNLQYKNTTIIIIFTYFIGVFIAFMTGQFNVTSFIDWFLFAILSIAVLGVAIIFMNEFNYHLKRIPQELKKFI